MARRRSALHGGYGVFLLPGLVLVGVVVGIPFLTNVAVSFTRWTGVGWPRWAGLANYRRAFADATFWASFEKVSWARALSALSAGICWVMST